MPTSSLSPAECPAVDAEGNLKDASTLHFYGSESDEVPLPPVPCDQDIAESRRTSSRKSTNKLSEILDAEKRDVDGNLSKQFAPKKQRKNPPRKKTSTSKKAGVAGPTVVGLGSDVDDEDDSDFTDSSDSSDSCPSIVSVLDSEDESTVAQVSNAELADILPSKSFPTSGRGSGKKKRQRQSEVSIPSEGDKAKDMVKKNPIHFFFAQVEHGADGRVGNPGDKHFKCYHGNQKIITLTKSMKYNLTTLINHLKANFPLMFKLFTILKARSSSEAITQEEIDVARGKKKLDTQKAKAWFDNLEAASRDIKDAFERQATAAAGPWDQEKFEELLAKWIVAVP
ncbi:hypothetical protein CPC08DRAFT_770290 [Agrocybe pediades]|nr:hypothetical protein CPC08DRAFT_770290 [Agrocybe pediades]